MALFIRTPIQASTFHITAYLPTGNAMYSGAMPFSGAAACSRRFPLGTVFQMWDGSTFECLDRGLLDENGVDIDLFAWSYGEAVYLMGQYDQTSPIVIRWGYGS